QQPCQVEAGCGGGAPEPGAGRHSCGPHRRDRLAVPFGARLSGRGGAQEARADAAIRETGWRARLPGDRQPRRRRAAGGLTMLQRFVDPAAVAAVIERVRSLSGDALRRRWQSAFGRSPAEHLTRDLLRRMIAARIQEEAFGTLDRATLKFLDGLARRDGSRRAERNLKIGTVLVRDYQGRRPTVAVGPDGFVWEGTSYSSLSAIARAITGTVWNGPRFFAIKPAPGDDPPAHGRRRAAPPA